MSKGLFDTALYTLPIALVLMLSAPLSGRLVGSYGPRRSLLAAATGAGSCAETFRY